MKIEIVIAPKFNISQFEQISNVKLQKFQAKIYANKI